MWFWKVCVLFTAGIVGHSAQVSSKAPLVKLNDGRSMPALGLGTWYGVNAGNVEKDSMEKAVSAAIDTGYRHIDTAAIYKTEEQVGRAVNKKIADGVIKREDMFITTKLWNDKHAKADVLPALQESLKQLNMTYVDLYLIHWPIAQDANGKYYDVDYTETWQALVEAQKQGFAKSIGVSNFNVDMLKRLIASSEVKPAALQVEINLNLQQPALLEYCRQQNITVTGYTPFGSLLPNKAAADAPPPRIDDSRLVEIAKKYNKTVPQVALRYLVELGVVPIPKSLTPSRIQQNIDVFDFQLSQQDKELLKSFDKGYRVISVKNWKDSPYFPFEK